MNIRLLLPLSARRACKPVPGPPRQALELLRGTVLMAQTSPQTFAVTPTSNAPAAGREVVSSSTLWKVIFASAGGTMIEWYDSLYLRKPRRDHLEPLLPEGQPDGGLPPDARHVRHGLRRPPVRRARVRAHRRYRRSEVRVPRDAAAHGRRDGAHRLLADVRQDRAPRPDRARPDPPRSRASRSAASMAARRCTSPSTRRREARLLTSFIRRSRRRSACSSRWR